MPDINTDVWGEGFYTDTSGLNKRTGASDISDQDYEDYKPFAYISQTTTPPAPETWSRSLHNIYARGGIELNAPIDESICYVGMYNEELPQLNIGVYYQGSTQEAPAFKTDNTAVQSFFLYGTYSLYNTYPNRYYMPNGFMPVPDYANYTKYIYWSPEAYSAAYPDTTNYNTNLKIDPYLKWGIRSLFLVIYVMYVSTYDASGMPVSTMTTLNDYVNGTGHDDNWKRLHKVLCAFGMPYIRRSTAGLYDSTLQDNCSVTPAFTLPYSGPYSGDEYDILMYIATLQGNSLNTRPDNLGAFPIYGSATPWVYTFPYGGSTTQQGYIHFGINRGELHTNVNNVYWFELDLTIADNIEYLMRGCAAYGLFFSDDYYTLGQEGRDETRWIDVNMCCGTIDEEGRTNGDYSRGVMNALQRQFDWSDSTQSPFDPSLPPVPENDYNTETVFNTVSGISTMTQRYALTAGAVKNLGTALWSISSDLIDDGGGGQDYSELNEKILDTFLTNNPIDCIVSLRKFPFEISKDDSTLVKLGKYETLVGGYTVSETIEIFEFRMKKKVLPLFNDSFMDYEPYTHFELYVPFCGTVSIEPADILDRSLSVRLAVDYSTGTCTAYILSDSLVIKTISGQIAIDIPVSGIQSVTAASQINNAIAQASTAHKQERSATLGNVSVGGAVQFMLNPVKTVESAGIAENAAQRADYELQHQNIQPHLIGSASSAAAWLIDFSCRLLIYYPTGEVLYNTNPPSFNPLKLLEYGHTVGFACCNTGTLSSFSGLTVAVRADLNNITTNGVTARPATLQELQLLEAALNEGVII